NLRGVAAELGWVDAGLDLEFLKSINGGQDHVGVEVGIGVLDAIEREMVEHDSLPGNSNRLAGAIAALAGTGLSGGTRERGDVRRDGGERQVIAAVEWQLRDSAALDHRADRGVLRLQQDGGALNLNRFRDLTDGERHVETDGLLDLHFHI